jgi:hypothetical protein
MADFKTAYKDALLDSFDDTELDIMSVDDDEDDSGDEKVGGDYAWYGAAAVEEDDDEASVSAEEAEAFGADDDAGDDETDLDEIEAAIERDVYGFDPSTYIHDFKGSLETRLEATGYEPAIGSIMNAFNPANVYSSAPLSVIEKIFATVKGGDAQELAAQLAVTPGFENWESLSQEDRKKLVEAAVYASVVPGIDMAWDDAFLQSWKDNEQSNIFVKSMKALASGAYTNITQDLPSAALAAMQEIPGLPAAIANKFSDQPDELFNGLAFGYWTQSKVLGVDVYGWIADNVTKAWPAISGQRERQADVPPSMVPSETTVSVESIVDLLPPLSIQSGPRPQDILAVGIVAMNVLAAMGFK